MPYPWSANDILTAADLNAAFSTGIITTGLGAAATYTPVWSSTGTAPSLGNGAITGRYIKVGRLVQFWINLTMGSTTTFGTSVYTFTLPVTAAAANANGVGTARLIDSSAGTGYGRFVAFNSTTTVLLNAEGGAFVTNTVPATWANGDSFAISGTYESAA